MSPEMFRKLVLELVRFHSFKIVNDHSDYDRIRLHIAFSKLDSKLFDLMKKFNLHLVENHNETYIFEITLLEK